MGDPNPLLEMLATALAMEEKGKAFYDRSAAAARNDLGRDIFRMLAEQEVVHMERIRRIHAALSRGQAGWAEWKELPQARESLETVFRGMAEKHGPQAAAAAGDVQALETGISLEAGSIRYYREARQKATDDAARDFLERMVVEEIGHRRALEDMKMYLENPAAYFRESERGGLDGA